MLGRGSALGNIGPRHGVTRVTGTRGHIISLGVTIRGRRNYVSTAEPESLVASDQGPGILVTFTRWPGSGHGPDVNKS